MTDEGHSLDVGCGPKKATGYVGLDHRAWPGVDVIFDLNSGEPWPFENDTFARIRASHIIEHLDDTVFFFSEAHRVARNGAILHIETPHYSSRDSWLDPTHVKHFSLFFTDPIVTGTLLPEQSYELVERKLSFGSFVKTWPQRLWAALFGLDSYERRCAWRWPATNIRLDLRIVK